MIARAVQLAAIGALLAVAPTSGQATSPFQVLALIAHPDGVMLQCADGTCSADLSAFCLQKGRATPTHGVRYRLLQPEKLELVGQTDAGETIRVAGSADWLIRAERDQVAVRITVPDRLLAAHGLTRAAVTVATNATLMPVAADGNSQGGVDDPAITLLREAGNRLVDQDRSRMGAVRTLARLASELPPTTGAPTDRVAHMPYQRLLQTAVSPAATAALSEAERRLARGTLDICRTNTDLGAYHSLRQCLEVQHDSILWTLNVDYWLAFDRGS